MVALVLGLGMFGFTHLNPKDWSVPPGPADRALPWHEALYQTLRLFTLNLDVPEGTAPPAYLKAAAFLAALVVVRTIAGLFPGKVSAWLGRWLTWPHLVVFGANPRAAVLLDTLPAPHPRRWWRPVVVVDPDPAALATITTPRVRTAAGDGASEYPLRHTIRRAHNVVVITGDNARNSTVTSAVLGLRPRAKGVLFVEVEQPGLARTLEQGGQRVDVETTTFSAAGLAATAVLDELGGVDWNAPGAVDDDKDTPPAVALFGTGALVDAVVLELHQRRRVQLLEGRANDSLPPRILLFGPDAGARRDALATLMGTELQVLDLDPLDVGLDQVVELTPETARHLARHPRLLRVMVLAPTDLDGGGIAITVARHIGPYRHGRRNEVVLVVESASSSSGEEIDRQSVRSTTMARVRCFRAPREAYRLELLQAQRVGERLARAMYEVENPRGGPWEEVATADRTRYLERAAAETGEPPGRPPTAAPWLSRSALVSLDRPEKAPLRALGFSSPSALARAGLHVDFHRLDALVAAARALVERDDPAAFGAWAEVARLRASYADLRDDLDPVWVRASGDVRQMVLLRRILLDDPDERPTLPGGAPLVLTRSRPGDPGAPIVVLAGAAEDRAATAWRLRPSLAHLPEQTRIWMTASTRALLDDPPPNVRGPVEVAGGRADALALWRALLIAGHHTEGVRTVALPGTSADDLAIARTLGAKVGRIVSSDVDDLQDILLNGSAGIVSLPDDPATVRAFLRPACWPPEYADLREPLARELHGRYVARQRTRKPAGDPALRPWSLLSPWLRRSNLAVVDDIPSKLTALGLELTTRPAGDPDPELVRMFTEHIDELGELEHGRFTAERVLSGWTSGMRNPTRFVTPYLLPWTQLSDEIKKYDNEVMRDVPEVLALHGLGARPSAP